MTIATDQLDLAAVPTPTEGEDQRVVLFAATFPDLADDDAFEAAVAPALLALAQAFVAAGVPATGLHVQIASTDVEVSLEIIDDVASALGGLS